jgi:hypothetical protein
MGLKLSFDDQVAILRHTGSPLRSNGPIRHGRGTYFDADLEGGVWVVVFGADGISYDGGPYNPVYPSRRVLWRTEHDLVCAGTTGALIGNASTDLVGRSAEASIREAEASVSYIKWFVKVHCGLSHPFVENLAVDRSDGDRLLFLPYHPTLEERINVYDAEFRSTMEILKAAASYVIYESGLFEKANPAFRSENFTAG